MHSRVQAALKRKKNSSDLQVGGAGQGHEAERVQRSADCRPPAPGGAAGTHYSSLSQVFYMLKLFQNTGEKSLLRSSVFENNMVSSTVV